MEAYDTAGRCIQTQHVQTATNLCYRELHLTFKLADQLAVLLAGRQTVQEVTISDVWSAGHATPTQGLARHGCHS